MQNQNISRIKATKEEIDATLEELGEKYGISTDDVLGIYALELINKNPEMLSQSRSPELMSFLGYTFGNLFLLTGEGALIGKAIERNNDGKIEEKCWERCNFYLFTPDIPKINSGSSVKYGLLTCHDRVGEKIKCGIVGQGGSLGEYCNMPFKEECLLNLLNIKIKPASVKELADELNRNIEEKNELVKSRKGEIYKRLNPLFSEQYAVIEEIINDIREKITNIGSKEERPIHYG